ncbi:MAG: DNA polymerase III subunit gamma/tau [Deltaproteobacteria bacterium]|nr:DNA polymerase III subunit gamma/tau [Deltaproteobacteria bacterium]
MSYVVLARRYRPQTFDEIVGQHHIVKILTNAINSGRIHHAFLFTGARGTGKTSSARLLAKALNCVNGPTAIPCNICSNCIDITDGKNVDVLEIDGATNTGVDSVRALREDIRYLPSSCRYRIIIIDEVHMLTTSAFNALLKTLEEPPPHVIFIFATTEPHKIPATILSRVQRFDFHRVETDELSSHISSILKKEHFEITPEACQIIAVQGEGSVRDSLSILDQVLAQHTDGTISADEVRNVLGISDRETLISLGEVLLSRNIPLLLKMIQDLFINGADVANLTKSLIGQLRDFLVVKAAPESAHLLTQNSISELKRISELVQSFEVTHIHHLQLRLFGASEHIARSHSPKVALEMILLDLCLSEPLLPIEKIASIVKKLPSTNITLNPGSAEVSTLGSEPYSPRVSHSIISKENVDVTPQYNSEAPKISPKQILEEIVKNSSGNETETKNTVKTVVDSSDTPPEIVTLPKWMAIVEKIKSDRPTIGFQLEEAKFSSCIFKNHRLNISLILPGMKDDDYIFSSLMNNKDLINKLVSTELSCNTVISFKTGELKNTHLPAGIPVKSVRDIKEQQNAVKKRQIEEDILGNPFVRTLLDEFQGEVMKFNVTDENE